MLPGWPTFEAFLKKPLVFDIDDAIWIHHPFGRNTVISIAKRADVIIAGNTHIADWLEPYARSLFIVPIAIDTEKFKPKPSQPFEKTQRFTIGWIGSPSNHKYLLMIEGPLSKFLNDYPDAELLVVSDVVPRFKALLDDRICYVPWSEDNEVAALKCIDVGIMPLPDNDWTRGKCGCKMLLYMACGIPVVVSPVGMSVEVLEKGAVGFAAQTDSDWYEAFSFFHKNRASAETYGNVGRTVVEMWYSQKTISSELADIFKRLS